MNCILILDSKSSISFPLKKIDKIHDPLLQCPLHQKSKLITVNSQSPNELMHDAKFPSKQPPLLLFDKLSLLSDCKCFLFCLLYIIFHFRVDMLKCLDNTKVHPVSVAADPSLPNQFAVGLPDGAVPVLEPREKDGTWSVNSHLQTSTGPSISSSSGAAEDHMWCYTVLKAS
ncbi:hypothetical protein Droror1_Dr00010023 [Drosera rotundifolia]